MGWARLEHLVYMYGWERSLFESQTRSMTQATTRLACRSMGLRNLAQPGSWEDLNLTTDGVLFVKNQALNGTFCFVSLYVFSVCCKLNFETKLNGNCRKCKLEN